MSPLHFKVIIMYYCFKFIWVGYFIFRNILNNRCLVKQFLTEDILPFLK